MVEMNWLHWVAWLYFRNRVRGSVIWEIWSRADASWHEPGKVVQVSGENDPEMTSYTGFLGMSTMLNKLAAGLGTPWNSLGTNVLYLVKDGWASLSREAQPSWAIAHMTWLWNEGDREGRIRWNIMNYGMKIMYCTWYLLFCFLCELCDSVCRHSWLVLEAKGYSSTSFVSFLSSEWLHKPRALIYKKQITEQKVSASF